MLEIKEVKPIIMEGRKARVWQVFQHGKRLGNAQLVCYNIVKDGVVLKNKYRVEFHQGGHMTYGGMKRGVDSINNWSVSQQQKAVSLGMSITDPHGNLYYEGKGSMSGSDLKEYLKNAPIHLLKLIKSK